MSASIIHTVHAPAAVGPYSQAVLTGGLLLTSGRISARSWRKLDMNGRTW